MSAPVRYLDGSGSLGAPDRQPAPAAWQLAAQRRRSTAVGYMLIGLAAATTAGIALSVATNDIGALVVMHAAIWVSLRSFANALDVALDVAWEWSEDGGHPRRPKRADGVALGLVTLSSRFLDRLDHPVAHEPVAVSSGIEVVEILEDPFEQ